jgi:hypothetical protein
MEAVVGIPRWVFTALNILGHASVRDSVVAGAAMRRW